MSKFPKNARTPLYKRIYLINRDFQLPYVRLAVWLGLGSTLLTSIIILFPLFQFRILRFPNFLPPPFLWAIVGAAVLNLFTIAGLGILITHRIAGPMFSLGRHFRMIRELNRFGSDLKLRDSDDMKFIVSDFNQLIAHMRDLTKKDLRQLAQLRSFHITEKYSDASILVEHMERELDLRLLAVPRSLPKADLPAGASGSTV